MEGKELQGNHTQYSLKTVHRVRNLNCTFDCVNSFGVLLVTDHNWTPLFQIRKINMVTGGHETKKVFMHAFI